MPQYLAVAKLVELGGFSRQALLGGTRAADRARFADVLALLKLSAQAHLPVNQLSGGQRQRAWIAMILAQAANVFLLDEAVNHLDIRFQ
ncbi:MAG: ABC transporter ATP-binding protein [Pseudomonadota bacterium]